MSYIYGARVRMDGVILKKHSVKEKDVFLTVFTREYGKLSIYARSVKSIRSKFGPFLRQGAILSFETTAFTHEKSPQLLGVKSIFIPTDLYYDDLILFEEFLKFLDRFCQMRDIHSHILTHVLSLIPLYFQTSQKQLLFFTGVIKVATELGMLPSFKHCVICEEKLSPASHFFRNGILCSSCATHQGTSMTISFVDIKILSFLQEAACHQIVTMVLDEPSVYRIQEYVNLILGFLQDHYVGSSVAKRL